MLDDAYPVRWAGRQVIVAMPEHLGLPNAGAVRDRLLTLINRGPSVCIVDLSATVSCDHAGADAIGRAYQRATASGTELRLVITSEVVRRVLGIGGIDRLVSVYPALDAALAASSGSAGRPAAAAALAASAQAGGGASPRRQGPGPPDSALCPPAGAANGTAAEVAELDEAGVIVSVNEAWRMFAAANGGDPARTGPGVSYLLACASAAGDPAADAVADAIRQALAGDLPGPLAVEVPCHSPDTERYFDVLISPGCGQAGRPAGATVTLSLAWSGPRGCPHETAAGPAAGELPGGEELLDRIAAGIFRAGLALQRADDQPDGPARQAAAEAAQILDDIVREIRSATFARHRPRRRAGQPGA